MRPCGASERISSGSRIGYELWHDRAVFHFLVEERIAIVTSQP